MAARKPRSQRRIATAGASAVVLELPARITIHEVRALHQQLLAQIGAWELVLDGSRVEQVDTAGLQLILAARRSAEAAGGRLEWRPLPAAVLHATRALGLDGEFGLGPVP